jgi:hypothetical protein
MSLYHGKGAYNWHVGIPYPNFLANDCSRQKRALRTEYHKQACIRINHVCIIRAMETMTMVATVMLHTARTQLSCPVQYSNLRTNATVEISRFNGHDWYSEHSP